jgi:hypothetical protein
LVGEVSYDDDALFEIAAAACAKFEAEHGPEPRA